MGETEKDWREEMKEILKPIEEHLGKLSSTLEHPSTPSEKGESEIMPIYKCSGKDCKFSTEDLGAFIEHVIDERVASKIPPRKIEEPKWEEEKPKTHSTVKEFLDCPDCAPKFEKELLTRGWKKPEEKPSKQEKKGLAL